MPPPTLFCSSCFFLYRYAAHRYRHSFPTRRSSDLLVNEIIVTKDFVHLRFYVVARVPIRSEEHTSELQSRVDLVCRLLLEKKNPERRMLMKMESVPQSRPQAVMQAWFVYTREIGSA